MNQTVQVFQRDNEGNVIDPPTNTVLEQRLTAARDSGDASEVARAQQEYDNWRTREVERIEAAADQPTPATDATTAGPTPGTEPGTDVPQSPTSITDLSPEQRTALRAELDAADAGTPPTTEPGAGSPDNITLPGGGAA